MSLWQKYSACVVISQTGQSWSERQAEAMIKNISVSPDPTLTENFG